MESLNREQSYPSPNSFNEYAAPIANRRRPMESTNSLIINQTSPSVITTVVINPDYFKLNPITIQCPFCHRMITTDVKTSWSCLALCLWGFTGWIPYFCIQCCRGKELCCQNAVHYCPCCNNQIGKYSAC